MSGTSDSDSGRGIGGFVASYRFPVLALSIVVLLKVAMLGVLLWPVETAFVEEFKIWCFGYDPATGTYQWASLVLLFLEPLVLGLVVLTVWWVPLNQILRERPAATVPWAALGLPIVIGIAAGFGSFQPAQASGELPFPAEALRIAHTPPEIELIDQEGAPVSLTELRGRVVVLTAVYAHCTHTCPAIVSQARTALDALTEAEREDVVVLGVTLDPEKDTPDVLATLARAQGLEKPQWRLATGEPARVEQILDQLDVSRVKDPETGVIEHVNLFLVVDRQGRLAYRFTLGERQARWLQAALRVLVAEPALEG